MMLSELHPESRKLTYVPPYLVGLMRSTRLLALCGPLNGPILVLPI
jgi:hypothetical protein